MFPVPLSDSQLAVIRRTSRDNIFLEGPAGSGKTTVGVERIIHLMAQGVPGDSILLIVPQRTLASLYYEALKTPGVVSGGMVTILTVGGLARRMVELFWPLVADEAGFKNPELAPTFLTLETAQYYMAHLVRPLLEESYFDSVTIDRNRLYSQIIDNLNKAAVVGFAYTEIGERLKSAWMGDPGQAHIYDDAQECAARFREYCLAHNLLDFSLQIEVFIQHLWAMPICQEYLVETYRHLFVDNVEEDTPIAHDLLREWLPMSESALVIYDQDAGYRRFLGADPQGAYELKNLCDEKVVFRESYVTSEEMDVLGRGLDTALRNKPLVGSPRSYIRDESAEQTLIFEFHRFYPQMLDWVAGRIAGMVREEGISPGEIVVLAPYLSDSLRFSLINRLDKFDIPVRSHRPSRSLREEPATLCLLTLTAIAHPAWNVCPTKFDITYALVQAIEGLDLVRAQILAEIVYHVRRGNPDLSSFERIIPEMQNRITYRAGERYESLRLWLTEYSQGPELELDHFLSRLFGEVLSQPGYGFHVDYDAGEVVANLIESIQKFRWAAGNVLSEGGHSIGKEYLEMVQDGVIAATYIRSWNIQPEDAVLLAPAYTYLMNNRAVDVQFWLDVGSRGWFERLYQPLTHPYVLSRLWSPGELWTDENEIKASQIALLRLSLGLIRRCRKRICLGLSELGEQGYEQRGPLLMAFQRVLRHMGIT